MIAIYFIVVNVKQGARLHNEYETILYVPRNVDDYQTTGSSTEWDFIISVDEWAFQIFGSFDSSNEGAVKVAHSDYYCDNIKNAQYAWQ